MMQTATAYGMLAFSVGLVVDGAEARAGRLDDDGRIALAALAAALQDAAGVPDDPRWRAAHTALNAFVHRADACELDPVARHATRVLYAFLEENADLAGGACPAA